MWYVQHKTISVTTFDEKYIKKAHRKAKQIFLKWEVTNIIEAPVNWYFSFFIWPTGSKYWRIAQEEWDQRKEDFIKRLKDDRNWYYDVLMCYNWEEDTDFWIDYKI